MHTNTFSKTCGELNAGTVQIICQQNLCPFGQISTPAWRKRLGKSYCVAPMHTIISAVQAVINLPM